MDGIKGNPEVESADSDALSVTEQHLATVIDWYMRQMKGLMITIKSDAPEFYKDKDVVALKEHLKILDPNFFGKL